jgi:hypothetical protein
VARKKVARRKIDETGFDVRQIKLKGGMLDIVRHLI